MITRAETLAGFDKRSARLALDLLDLFTTLPIAIETADAAARPRRTERWKLPDGIQAALTIEHDLTLTTRNTRDFQPSGQPHVWIPYTL